MLSALVKKEKAKQLGKQTENKNFPFKCLSTYWIGATWKMKNENKEKHCTSAKLKHPTFRADLFFLKKCFKKWVIRKKWAWYIMHTSPPFGYFLLDETVMIIIGFRIVEGSLFCVKSCVFFGCVKKCWSTIFFQWKKKLAVREKWLLCRLFMTWSPHDLINIS